MDGKRLYGQSDWIESLKKLVLFLYIGGKCQDKFKIIYKTTGYVIRCLQIP